MSKVDPKTAVLCYSVFACLLTWGELADMSLALEFVRKDVVSRHALLFWRLSEKTHGQIVEKISLSIMPNLSSFLLSQCSVSDK